MEFGFPGFKIILFTIFTGRLNLELAFPCFAGLSPVCQIFIVEKHENLS